MSADKISRRALFQLGIGATAGTFATHALGSTVAAPGCGSMTPQQIMGPFYPEGDQADKDMDLTLVRGHAERAYGEVIYVRGRVLDEACSPIAGAVVEIWQASGRGRYSHERDPNPTPMDPHFQGRGQVVTDDEGRYGFRTIKPAPYPLAFLNGQPDGEAGWRTAHIHYRVARRGFHETITQMYFPGEALNEKDGTLLSLPEGERSLLIATPQPPAAEDEAGARPFGFDITLKRVAGTGGIPLEILQEYTGSYGYEGATGGPRTITVSRDGARLLASLSPNIPAVELRSLSRTRFGFAAIRAEIEFVREPEGRVERLRLHTSGGDVIEAPRTR